MKALFMKKTFAILLCFTLACSKHPSKTVDKIATVVNIDPNKNEHLYLSQIADSISYIQLETSDISLLGEIRSVRYKNGVFYVQDRSNSIFLFDLQGNFISKFNQFGQGPGEYVFIHSFDVGESGDIHILDLYLKKMLAYNASFEFVSEIRIEDFPRDFYVLDEKYVLYMPDKNIDCRTGIYSLDRKTQEYSEILKIKATNDVRNGYITSCAKGYYAIADYSSNNVYYLKEDSLISAIHIQGNNVGTNVDFESGKIMYFPSGFADYEDLLYFSIYKPEHFGKMCLYNKTTNEYHIYSDGNNDIDGKEIGVASNITINNQMVSIVSGELSETFEENNPRLQIIHLKQ